MISLHRAGPDVPLPSYFPARLFDRVLVIILPDGSARGLAWRWRPFVRWRYLPRAWGMTVADGLDATAWTGRDRELLAIDWPVAYHRWSADMHRRMNGND